VINSTVTTTIILSRYQTKPILEARGKNAQTVEVSLDLGLTVSQLELDDDGVRSPTGQLIMWEELEKIDKHEVGCFVIDSSGMQKVQLYSEEMSRVYTLMPTSGPPTMLISGLPMHRIKGTDPQKDTRSKINTVKPVTGLVLDTATGLGYTAIEAAKSAEKVITMEIDPTVIEICRLNPWSRALFKNRRIESRIGDIYDEILSFEDSIFSRIIHDPPTFSLAGHLYSADFYRQMFRVLRSDGRLFHYIGDLSSRSGRRTARGVVQRLKDAGFRRVRSRKDAFGVVASR